MLPCHMVKSNKEYFKEQTAKRANIEMGKENAYSPQQEGVLQAQSSWSTKRSSKSGKGRSLAKAAIHNIHGDQMLGIEDNGRIHPSRIPDHLGMMPFHSWLPNGIRWDAHRANSHHHSAMYKGFDRLGRMSFINRMAESEGSSAKDQADKAQGFAAQKIRDGEQAEYVKDDTKHKAHDATTASKASLAVRLAGIETKCGKFYKSLEMANREAYVALQSYIRDWCDQGQRLSKLSYAFADSIKKIRQKANEERTGTSKATAASKLDVFKGTSNEDDHKTPRSKYEELEKPARPKLESAGSDADTKAKQPMKRAEDIHADAKAKLRVFVQRTRQLASKARDETRRNFKFEPQQRSQDRDIVIIVTTGHMIPRRGRRVDVRTMVLEDYLAEQQHQKSRNDGNVEEPSTRSRPTPPLSALSKYEHWIRKLPDLDRLCNVPEGRFPTESDSSPTKDELLYISSKRCSPDIQADSFHLYTEDMDLEPDSPRKSIVEITLPRVRRLHMRIDRPLPPSGLWGSDQSLEMSLQSGLDKLSGSKYLKELNVHGMRRKIGAKEIQWMKVNWPKIRVIYGVDKDASFERQI
ncbi:MAG: hypothetical protein J3Q66DRAFT_414974 [Benniella sp.]|nr:MAG: hypothetical protein J3Q66DRAFT_414974 [Benniella sp.]